jgi:hypothetical protein
MMQARWGYRVMLFESNSRISLHPRNIVMLDSVIMQMTGRNERSEQELVQRVSGSTVLTQRTRTMHMPG